MKNISKLAGFLSLLAICCLIIAGCKTKEVDVTDKIKEANAAFATAVANTDTAALMAMYTKDAKIFPANAEIVDGREAIGGMWAMIMNMGIKKVQFETSLATSYGTIAIEEGSYTLYVAGDTVADHGKYIVTWKLEDGKWKVFRDIWNGNTPPPPPPATEPEPQTAK